MSESSMSAVWFTEKKKKTTDHGFQIVQLFVFTDINLLSEVSVKTQPVTDELLCVPAAM